MSTRLDLERRSCKVFSLSLSFSHLLSNNFISPLWSGDRFATIIASYIFDRGFFQNCYIYMQRERERVYCVYILYLLYHFYIFHSHINIE